MAEKQMIEIVVVPTEPPADAPYANTSFSYTNGPNDVTIVFMRAPLLGDPDVERLGKEAVDGRVTVRGHTVSAVTMPRAIALDLARKLVSNLDGVAGQREEG